MEELIDKWLFDPVVGKILASALVVLFVVVLVRYTQRGPGQYVEDSQRRYRLRKLATIGGYVIALVLLSVVCSDKLSGLTVMFGVLGAGIAFALQEVIVSVADWIALSFKRLCDVGDRVQLGGIRGDIIDIGVLRTTLMECGGWINGDQYNGRVVRVSNSLNIQ